MYESTIEKKSRDKWNGVFATNETIIDEKEEISKLDFCIRKDYDVFGQTRERSIEKAEAMVKALRDLLLHEDGLKVIINKNIRQQTALHELYVFKLLIMKRPIGED